MSISDEDLFLAILALDSYNRGVGAGLRDENLGEAGQIGNAQILSLVDIGITEIPYAAWQAAGFYAVAYSTPYGTVISYQGTDFTPFSDALVDAFNGWTLGTRTRLLGLSSAASF